MTSSSENNIAIKTVDESSMKENVNEENTQSFNDNEDKNNLNDDTTIQTVNNTEQKQVTINHLDDDHRSKKPFNSKVKYSSMSYHRSPYFTNGHPYGPTPYYYYQFAPINEKPTPLMVIPTQLAAASSSPSTTTTTTTTTTADNETGNSTAISPSNLPPRLRQTSANENDSANPPTSTSQSNIRRHRSILPRGSSNYYSLYPPPPLMATPPGVLYPYQPGHIAYNIRTPDELEILAFQQQFMNLAATPVTSPFIWPSAPTPAAYHQYPSYPMYEPTTYMYNNSSTFNSNNSHLNPDAAEWIPTQTDTNTSSSSSSDANLLIDDEINFPPLNVNRTDENNIDQTKSSSNDSLHHTDSVNNNDNNIQQTKLNSIHQDENKHSSSTSKSTTISYSTVILQTPDRTKSTTINTQQQQQSQLSTKKRTQVRLSLDNQIRTRQSQQNRMNLNETKTSSPIETSKQQTKQSNDDWIEVKSKKTKKFDRFYDNSLILSEKIFVDERNIKQSTIENTTTTTCTSDDDEISDNQHRMTVENQIRTITTTDYNQIIIDDIHQRLNNNEKLLIIMRGCPGSGKSTLAKSLNNGYNGQIISIDEYLFDASKLDEAHLNNRQLASDAFKRNISPIIIDNTNATSWEMKPYVVMGKEADYDIVLIEPQTPWRYKPRELVKRNLHNVSLRRVKDILNRFEHDLTVECLLNEIKANSSLSSYQHQQQIIIEQNPINNEYLDSIQTRKQTPELFNDSTILNDVRLCIDDMILFLTSTFYQTSLSIPFMDLSIVSSSSSSPTSPSTPHSLFHRTLSRYSSSTTTNQDHCFSTEHIRRMPTTGYSRCVENLTPPPSSSAKRRKNKIKQTSNDIFLNTNNSNNNTNNDDIFNEYYQLKNYEIYLPEQSLDYIVINEQDILSENHSSINLQQQTPSNNNNNNNQLLNIIHDGFTQTSVHRQLPSNQIDIGIQSTALIIDDNDRILFGNLSNSTAIISTSISPAIGHIERGIQVDFNENTNDALQSLIEIYADRLSPDIIRQYYELCQSDIQWTRTQLDEYLCQTNSVRTIPTLRQLSLNALHQWNEQIKCSNQSFDTVSISDLLDDINNEDIAEDFLHENQTNQLNISSSMIDSLEQLYGELPNSSALTHGLMLPLDDELSLSIYQGLQRFLGVSTTKSSKNNQEKKIAKKNSIKQQQQQMSSQWISSTTNQTQPNSPSLKQIMAEELNILTKQKSKAKQPLNFANQHKFKDLQQQFPHISSDLLHEMFAENEFDYDLTYTCISSMLDDNVPSKTHSQRTHSQRTHSTTNPSSLTNKPLNALPTQSFEQSRHHAHQHALNRKECYNKADQANRHGMTGVASYYINQAREQTRLMKEANRRACEHIYRIRFNEFRQTNRLDLHELHADEALQLFQRVEQELTNGIRRTTLKTIEIITGYGKNSPYGGGTGRIRSTIIAYIRQRNYKYSEPNKGAILVQL